MIFNFYLISTLVLLPVDIDQPIMGSMPGLDLKNIDKGLGNIILAGGV